MELAMRQALNSAVAQAKDAAVDYVKSGAAFKDAQSVVKATIKVAAASGCCTIS